MFRQLLVVFIYSEGVGINLIVFLALNCKQIIITRAPLEWDLFFHGGRQKCYVTPKKS